MTNLKSLIQPYAICTEKKGKEIWTIKMRLKLINQEGNLQYILYNIQFYGKPTQ